MSLISCGFAPADCNALLNQQCRKLLRNQQYSFASELSKPQLADCVVLCGGQHVRFAGFASSIAQQLSIWSEHTVTQDRLLLFGGPFVLDWLLDKAVSAAGKDQQAAERALINLLNSGLLSSSIMRVLAEYLLGKVLIDQFLAVFRQKVAGACVALSRQEADAVFKVMMVAQQQRFAVPSHLALRLMQAAPLRLLVRGR